jgi:hypothetical protein
VGSLAWARVAECHLNITLFKGRAAAADPIGDGLPRCRVRRPLARSILIYPWLGAVLGFGFLRWRTPVLRRRLAAALSVNEEAAAELGVAPTRVHLPGEPWLRPGRRRRELVIFLSSALVLVAYILVATSFLNPTRGR